MTYKNIRVEIEGGLAVLSIDRPEARNALNTSTLQELESAFRAAAGNSQLRVLIVTGAGEKAFVAGGGTIGKGGMKPPPAGGVVRPWPPGGFPPPPPAPPARPPGGGG